MVKYTADLEASSEVPAANSKGSGTLDATYDTTTKKLTYTVTYKDLTGPATMAHFHGPADAKSNAGVVIPVKGSVASPIKGEATLDRRPGGRPRRWQAVLQRPHRGEQRRRDPRSGDEVHVA